jgi:sodium/potassium/calcium exchanger 6
MTVLAWGNSIPDLFNNLSCAAKPGGGSMAIAACYGGPIFNLLVGFGLSLLLTTLRPDIYPNPYQFPLNYSLVISISVLIFILLTTTIVLIYSDFQLTPQFGFFLLAVYFCYLIFQIHLVL